jgi:ABC-type arginine transport system permease subunit
MERSKPNLVVMALLFFIGVMTMFHFSQNVRIVDAVGLSGSGAACGAAMFGFIFALKTRNKT